MTKRDVSQFCGIIISVPLEISLFVAYLKPLKVYTTIWKYVFLHKNIVHNLRGYSNKIVNTQFTLSVQYSYTIQHFIIFHNKHNNILSHVSLTLEMKGNNNQKYFTYLGACEIFFLCDNIIILIIEKY